MIRIPFTLKRIGILTVMLLSIAVISVVFVGISSAVSQKMSYEGTLYDSSGNALTGSYNMRFSIVNSGTGSSSVIWGPETHSNVQVVRGLFSVTLGESSPISPSVFDEPSLYLRIEIANPPTSSNYELMSPSTAIVSVGSAFKAIEAQTAATVSDGSITAGKIAAGAVTKEALGTSNAPSNNQYLRWYDNSLQWATVSGGGSSAEADNVTIGTNAFGSLEVKDMGISSTKISTSAVTAEKLAAGAVTKESIATLTPPVDGQYLRWSSGSLQWATVSGGGGSGTPDGTSIGTNAYGSLEVKTSGISTSKIADYSVTEPKLATGAVTSGAIAAGAVTGVKLANNIDITTSGSISAASLVGTHYGSGANLTGITATSVADYSISSTKIATSAVTADKISSGAVTADAIAAGAVSTSEIASGAVTSDKLSEGISINTSGKVTAEAFYGSGAGLIGIIATTANYAAVAGSATSAASAITANTANYATLSGTATSAATANIANYAAVAGSATSAASAVTANTANYAALSGTATSAASVADYAITSTKIATSAVSAAKIALNAVTADAISAGAVTTSKLASNININTSGIITADAFRANSINSAGTIEVSSGGIKYPDGTIQTSASQSGNLLTVEAGRGLSKTASGNITTLEAVADNSTLTIESNALKIKARGVTSVEISAGAITKDAISTSNTAADNQYLRWYSGALQWSTVSGGSGGSAEPDNITIGRNAFNSFEVKDLGVSTAKIANSAVTASKLAPSSVTNESIAAGTFPNITGVGTLDSLSVSGALRASAEVIYPQSPTNNVSAGTGITAAMLNKKLIRIQGNGEAVIVTANPAIAAGQDGQTIILRGVSDTNTVKFNDGNGLSLSSKVSFTLGNGDTLMLFYDLAAGTWFELNRNDN